MKKTVSWVLILCMLLSLFVTPAVAETEEAGEGSTPPPIGRKWESDKLG